MSWLLHLVLTVVSAAWLYEGHSTESAETVVRAPADARPPLVVVRALGPVPVEELRTAEVLRQFPCVV